MSSQNNTPRTKPIPGNPGGYNDLGVIHSAPDPKTGNVIHSAPDPKTGNTRILSDHRPGKVNPATNTQNRGKKFTVYLKPRKR